MQGTTVLRVVGLVLLLGWAAPLRAQDPCDALILRAFNEFETARRVQILVEALNPGPRCGSWGVAVQALAQTLIEDGKDSVASVWLRWAARRDRDLQPDTLQFLPKVVEAYRKARAFVNATRSPADSLTGTGWLWASSGGIDAFGRIQVSTGDGGPALRVAIVGVGLSGTGGSLPIGAGSYVIVATAPGYDTLRVTREVLPGMGTVLEFRPKRTSVPVAVRPPAPPPAPVPAPAPAPTAVAARKKKFPVLLVAGGAVGAAVVVALAMKPKPEDPYGSIEFTFPNP